ncbi:Eco57I restriction-modification methylase domain-containing protein [Actinokineospora sp. G85]|uniref:Eco57I restriction-modification methylase domain-containing protein n=1 Tax=Actinokineospora sp. G85 TaxID=3406626 RepID=UPI003C780BFF
MSAYDSVVVEGEFVSEHFLAEEFPAKVRTLRKDWAEREGNDDPTARKGLASLGGRYVAALTNGRERTRQGHLAAIHADVAAALLLAREPEDFTSVRGSAEQTVRARVFRDTGRLPLLVLEACDARAVEDLLDADGSGRLLYPLTAGKEAVSATAKVLSNLFLADDESDRPECLLVLAGGWLLLAERTRWPEGRWLAVDLATAADRRDTTAAGELETIAALVGADALLPRADGSTLLGEVLTDSVKHAVGVSQDLREGIRQSIELVASEIMARRRARDLPDVPELATQLTRQSLRFLYRILFLLYAEARPELGVLPVDAPEYVAGYGLDRLRELVSVTLTTDRAEQGTHLYESLHRLFVLVDQGHNTDSDDDRGGLRFESMRADLFIPSATPLVDEVKLGNRCVQLVLEHLLLSKQKRGRDRGFVSYAQLGINQLGAVYEGLMSYTGFFAEKPLYEVARGGDRSKGTWLVPVAEADRLVQELRLPRDEVLVLETDPQTGEMVPVRHETGSFVFRLSGRERQRSASYYTPEVLTRCVVTHSLAELLDQNGERTPAAAILDLTVCEPALGSGAFLIEAVNQLAAQYLRRREEEIDERIPAEDYQAELQKVKAHLSLHQCYGVDLNATAVEFAEISLWLNAMHKGLSGPWFGLHLRRGNSLIGARRSLIKKSKLAKKAWLTTVADDRQLSEPVDVDEIHHFLLPSKGWGAVADTKEAKELRPEKVAELKAWRRAAHASPDARAQDRLLRLSRRVEKLWDFSRKRLRIAEAEIRRGSEVWKAEGLNTSSNAVSREQIEKSLANENGAYRRLRRVMDAWCALWFWPVTTEVAPPSWKDWLGGLEALLGVADKIQKVDQGNFAEGDGWAELDEAEQSDLEWNGAREWTWVQENHLWLKVVAEIAARESFFHWELDFSPVFERGGFDLQVGNPPWVRPTWDETLAFAETDPWFGLAHKPSTKDVRDHRDRALSWYEETYLDERAAIAGLSEHLGSPEDRPVLTGTQPDLYRCFMERTWRSMGRNGIVGLIHPETHFTEARAGGLRRETYQRLRRHWHFWNLTSLFPEISHKIDFGVHAYGTRQSVNFLSSASLFHPDVVDRSLLHDGSGAEPAIRDEDGRWDLQPHSGRIVRVDEELLRRWADLVDEVGTPALEARMLRPVNRSSQAVLDKIAKAPRLAEIGFQWTRGWEEDRHRREGFFEGHSAIPEEWSDVILQGPHFTVATPFAKQPRATMRSNQDYVSWDLETLDEGAIPRTNYQRALPPQDYIAGYKTWDGKPSSEYWRLAWRAMADSSTERTLHSCLLPPGPAHVLSLFSLKTENSSDLVVASGFWSSLAADFLTKVTGKTNLKIDFVRNIPHVRGHGLEEGLILRVLRLNCLTRAYEPLWSELFVPAWRQDSWTHDRTDRPALGDVQQGWEFGTPVRIDFDRRQALVEIDAIVSVMLGITAEELATIYRTQFGVLRKYERAMRFDANGRQVSANVLKEYDKHGSKADLGRYVLPFEPVDREKDMTRAHEVFTARLAAR